MRQYLDLQQLVLDTGVEKVTALVQVLRAFSGIRCALI